MSDSVFLKMVTCLGVEIDEGQSLIKICLCVYVHSNYD